MRSSTTDVVTWTHVVLDGSLSDAAAAFWADALDGSWRAAGPSPALAASLVPVDGDPFVHRTGRGSVAPSLVLEVDDVGATVRRLRGLGAAAAGAAAGAAGAAVVLRSPGGLSLGLTTTREHRRAPAARRPDGTRSRLVQVCLDCPDDLVESEAEFWRAATGWAWRGSDSAEFVCHLVPGAGSLQLLLQRRASALPREVTLHLDLGASDREAEADRLVSLGATRVATGSGWIVLRDPDGRTFCATGQPPEAP